jgi:peptide/nickel transport system permease protein
MVFGPDPASPANVLIGEGLVETPGSSPSSTPGKAIQGRSLWQIAWTRLKRDRVAMAGGVIVILLILIAIFAPLIVQLLGHPPNDHHQDPALLVPELGNLPRGPFGGMSRDYLFGLEPENGRDLFSRVVYGSRISLLIAFVASLLSVSIGTVLGIVAGYFGGWVDTLIARAMDVFLAFPLIVFAIALGGVIPDHAFGLSGDSLRIAMLIFIIGFFNWGYIARIVRGQTLSLREREFVDAARSLGARGPRIIFREILPNLVAPILVYTTLLIPTNILFESALSFLGVGIQAPTATWGNMLSGAVKYYTSPNFMFWPGMAIFITVLAFNMFGDGLRDAFDPKSK